MPENTVSANSKQTSNDLTISIQQAGVRGKRKCNRIMVVKEWCVLKRVKTKTVYLRMICCSFSLLFTSVCKDLNFLQVIFNKPLCFFGFF